MDGLVNFLRMLETLFSAATFAEAGEHGAAGEMLDTNADDAGSPDGRRLAA